MERNIPIVEKGLLPSPRYPNATRFQRRDLIVGQEFACRRTFRRVFTLEGWQGVGAQCPHRTEGCSFFGHMRAVFRRSIGGCHRHRPPHRPSVLDFSADFLRDLSSLGPSLVYISFRAAPSPSLSLFLYTLFLVTRVSTNDFPFRNVPAMERFESFVAVHKNHRVYIYQYPLSTI